MSNRTTLEELDNMTLQELTQLPLGHIAMLFEDVAELEATVKGYKSKLDETMALRFAERAALARKAKGKDTGTVTIVEDEYAVSADLPKAVVWDQAGLAKVEAQLIEMGEPVTDYIKLKRTISESAYNNWPASLCKMFEPHRTVGAGKPSYKIARKAGA